MVEVKEQGPFERLVTVTLDAESLAEGKRKAAHRLSREHKIKGFREGKAPVKVVESMVGVAELRREAIDDALPPVLTRALEEADLEPVVYPRLAEVRDEGDDVEVDVLVTLWPAIDEVPEYAGMEVTVELPEVTDEDVDDQVERMRNQFAELDDVKREAFEGDFVLADVTTTLDGEEFAAGSATDMLYELGSKSFLDGMDEALAGSGAGAIVAFESTLPEGIGEQAGKPVAVRALVKQVKTKRLPELTDEWVEEISEFETVQEMRAELLDQMTEIRRSNAWQQVEEAALSQLIERMDVDLPAGLLDAEMDTVFHRFAHRLEQQGVPLDQYLSLTGQDQESFVGDLRSQASLNLMTRLLLEGVADQEGIAVEPAELQQTITALAEAAGVSEEDYRTALAEGGREVTLASDILRRKAIDRILDLVVPVDEDGAPVSLPDRATGGSQDGVEMDEADDDSADEGADDAAPNEDDGHEPAEVDE